MTNYPLLKHGIKSNYKVFIIFLAILTMYITIITSMFDPSKGSALQEFAEAMPEFMAMVGMSGIFNTLNGYMANYLYGFLLMLVPLIFTIILTNKLIMQYVDRGSMAYLLASPNSRKKVALTQMQVQVLWIITIIVVITLLETISAITMFPNYLDMKGILMLNLGLLILHLAIGSLCFFASCVSNETKNYYMIAAGIPLVSFLIQMIVNMGGSMTNLKYITFFTLFDASGLIQYKTSAIIMLFVMSVLTIILYIIGIKIFCKKDLHI